MNPTALLKDEQTTLLFVSLLSISIASIAFWFSSSTTKTAAAVQSSPPNDSRLTATNSVLLVLSSTADTQELCKHFFGTVVYDLLHLPENLTAKTLFICGDLSRATGNEVVDTAREIYIISHLSHNYDDSRWSACPVVDVGRVPVDIHGVGVYYRRFFNPDLDFFNKIRTEHVFQALTESNKPGTAHRTGIYLTPVDEEVNGDLRFRLLRCSTNLAGPTGSFRSSDQHIVDTLNQEADCIFQNQAPLNHVLAQIYRNTPSAGRGKKATKAKIKDHSDKTKDMPENGLMAFVTFYDTVEMSKLSPLRTDPFDYGVRDTSALTKLVFRLKACVLEGDPASTLPRHFSLTLHPNSVFFMPLSTNRLYTHEIRPSQLDAQLLPTRMGYVVRCSDAEALFRDGQTYLQQKEGSKGQSDTNPALVKLEPLTSEGMTELRHLYAQENRSDKVVDYGEVLFSMNKGDYVKPLLYNIKDDFSCHLLPTNENIFAGLKASVLFEPAGKGRLGAMLVKVDPHKVLCPRVLLPVRALSIG